MCRGASWTCTLGLVKQSRTGTLPRELVQRVPQWTCGDRQAATSDAVVEPIVELGQFFDPAVQSAPAKSARLDAREFHNLRPLLGFVGNQFAELGRRVRKHGAT